MKNKELLPCPFCGGDAVLKTVGKATFYVECVKCGIKTKHYPVRIRTEPTRNMAIAEKQRWAIEFWNTRTNKIPVGNREDYEVTHNDIKK